MQILWYIQSLRFLAFFTSLSTFICHLAQCILLNMYQEKVDHFTSCINSMTLIFTKKKKRQAFQIG